MIFGYITLATALTISLAAIYYSVSGLMAIFSGAPIAIMVMGSILEFGKLIAVIWLHLYWHRAGFIVKTYLCIAVFVLMVITSMGIFGGLSSAHSEQNLATATNQVQIESLDARIAAEQRRVDSAEIVLSQLDETVQTLIDFSRIRGADGAIAVRESQRDERDALQFIIDEARLVKDELERERFELMQQRASLEAEVGPLKYIAAVIYGDNPDKDTLENAVRWVIILLVGVFDPLAIMLVLAGVMTLEWAAADKRNKKTSTTLDNSEVRVEYIDNPIYVYETVTQYVDNVHTQIVEREVETVREIEREVFVPVQHTVDNWVAVDNYSAQQDIDYATIKLKQLQQRVNELEHSALANSQHVAQTNNEKQILMQQLSAATGELESLQQEHSAVKEKASTYEEQLDTAVEQLSELVPQLDAAIADKQQLETQLAALQQTLDNTNNDYAIVADEMLEFQSKMHEAQDKLDAALAAVELLEKVEKIVDIDELLSYNKNPIKHVSELKDTIDVQQEQIKQLHTDLDAMRVAGKNTVLKGEVDRLTAEYEATVKKLTDELDRSVSQRSALATEVELLKHRITELTSTLDSAVHHATPIENSTFGLKYPTNPAAGDVFLRIDYKPARLYKYTGQRWLPVERTSTDSYITDEYVEYLIKNLDSRHLTEEDLTENEEFYVNKVRKNS